MKKYMAVIMGVVLVLGFAASAFAIHAEIPSETQAVVGKGATQITIGGDIRFRAEVRQNTSTFNEDVRGANQAYYDTRVRLSVEAKVTPNTMGMIMLESGNADNNDVVIWGNYSDAAGSPSFGDAKGTYRYGDGKKGDVRILQAWIQHSGSGLLGVPALVKVGHMPITVGRGLFYDHSKYGDDAILLGVDPVKNMHIILGDVKSREGDISLADDGDVYTLLFNYDFDKGTALNFDVTYVNQQNNFCQQSPVSNVPCVIPPGGNLNSANNGIDVHLWNIGLNGKVAIGPVDLYGDIEFQTGKVEDVGADNNDAKFKGYAGVLGGYFTIAPVRLNLEFAYASGQKADDDDIKTFATSQSNIQHFTYVYDYRTVVNAAHNPQGGLQNTWYIKGGASWDITKEFNALLNLYYLQAVKKIDSACIGEEGPDGVCIGVTRNNYGFPNTSSSKDIGFEIDWKGTWKIDRNLTWWLEGGYLFAGNFWKAVSGRNNSPDDAYAIRQGLQLSF